MGTKNPQISVVEEKKGSFLLMLHAHHRQVRAMNAPCCLLSVIKEEEIAAHRTLLIITTERKGVSGRFFNGS